MKMSYTLWAVYSEARNINRKIRKKFNESGSNERWKHNDDELMWDEMYAEMCGYKKKDAENDNWGLMRYYSSLRKIRRYWWN